MARFATCHLALSDGKRYLIEKYSVALTPGLQLLEPRLLQKIHLQSLTGGLTEARSGFSALLKSLLVFLINLW